MFKAATSSGTTTASTLQNSVVEAHNKLQDHSLNMARAIEYGSALPGQRKAENTGWAVHSNQ